MTRQEFKIYVKYFILSELVINSIAILQWLFVMNQGFKFKFLAVPSFVGIMFGIFLGKINLLKQEILHSANTDSLTGIANRRWIQGKLLEAMALAKRYGIPFSVLILDIDNFKQINDSYGHLIGDSVLIKMAETIQENCRETDFLARWGGEEFLILLPNTELKGAVASAEKIRSSIEQNNFHIKNKTTCSIGIAQYSPGFSLEEVVHLADTAMYEAKQTGKNRVVASTAQKTKTGKTKKPARRKTSV